MRTATSEEKSRCFLRRSDDIMDMRMFYGLTHNPFEKNSKDVTVETIDTKEMQGRLKYLCEVKGIGVFTGNPGAGKTYNLRIFTSSLSPSLYQVVYMPMSTLTTMQFYRYLADSLGLEVKHSKVENFINIQSYIKRMNNEKRITPVIIIDEAQYLKSEILNDLKILMNFDMDSVNHCVIILAGLPALSNTLRYASYEAIRQRITIQYQIVGIEADEVKNYIIKKLESAGLNVPIFTEDAYISVANSCQGSIRKLNNIVTQCLIIGANKKCRDINNEIVMNAVNEINM